MEIGQPVTIGTESCCAGIVVALVPAMTDPMAIVLSAHRKYGGTLQYASSSRRKPDVVTRYVVACIKNGRRCICLPKLGTIREIPVSALSEQLQAFRESVKFIGA